MKTEIIMVYVVGGKIIAAGQGHSKVAQWWSTRLLTDRLWVRAPPLEPISCRSGGIGRRTGLKIPAILTDRTGSTPVPGTISNPRDRGKLRPVLSFSVRVVSLFMRVASMLFRLITEYQISRGGAVGSSSGS